MGYTNYGSSIIGSLADMKARDEAEKLRQKMLEEKADQEEYDKAGRAQGGTLGALIGAGTAFLTGGASLLPILGGAATGYTSGSAAGRDPAGAIAGGFGGGYQMGEAENARKIAAAKVAQDKIDKTNDLRLAAQKVFNILPMEKVGDSYAVPKGYYDASKFLPGVLDGYAISTRPGKEVELMKYMSNLPENEKQAFIQMIKMFQSGNQGGNF